MGSKLDLESLPDEELLEELARRNAIKRALPQPLANPDFTVLTEAAVEGLAKSAKDGYEDEDFEQYIYEEAMKAVFGEDFFDWRNKQDW